MATAEEQHAATTAKLDDLVSKMAALTEWMQTTNMATADLAKNTTRRTRRRVSPSWRREPRRVALSPRSRPRRRPPSCESTSTNSPKGAALQQHTGGRNLGEIDPQILLPNMVCLGKPTTRSIMSLTQMIHERTVHTRTMVTAPSLLAHLRWTFRNLTGRIIRFGLTIVNCILKFMASHHT